ncbi:unnamed protein product, partial [Bubo scandiacus]
AAFVPPPCTLDCGGQREGERTSAWLRFSPAEPGTFCLPLFWEISGALCLGCLSSALLSL